MNFHIPKQLAALSRITYGKRVHPQRDWLLLLLLALLLLLLCAGWSVWMFVRGAASEATQAPTTPTASVSTQIFDATNALFEARSLEEGRYRSEYRFVDPRL